MAGQLLAQTNEGLSEPVPALKQCRSKQHFKTIASPVCRVGYRGITRAHASLFLIVWMCTISVASGQARSNINPNNPNTPPPLFGDKPIISNNVVYNVKHLPQHCKEPFVVRYPSGGVVHGRRAMLERDNPHVIKGNIEIPPGACLWIEPGCVLRFDPGYGIIVNGTLIARGSEEPGGRITMTKNKGPTPDGPTGDWNYDARLSGGNTTQDGRLDLLYNSKWRAICTNYHNFTEIDLNVTCRHLGFLKGNFTYHSFARNLTNYMLWEKPGCTGSENSLFDCPGVNRIRTGAHICDGQQVVGFECEGLRPGLAVDHWRGIQFFNSTSHSVRSDDNVYNDETWSWLEYLDISYPGLDIFHGRTREPGIHYPIAAISASPLVPLMNNVTIRYGAYDGLNLTDITGPIHVANSTIHKCRGHGMYIKTAVGMTLVNTTDVTENWGDGIKLYISNLTIHDFRQNFTFDSGFCFRASSSYQNYPTFQHLDAVRSDGEKLSGSSCSRSFPTTRGKSVNLHFMLMERDPEAHGTLTVREGYSGSGPLIGVYDVSNGTFPQSVRSRSSTMWIKFNFNLPREGCKVFQPCLRFLIRLSTSNGTENEFHMVYSKVLDNVGYGVNIQDMRSKVFLNTSEVSRNQFGAGVRVYQGAGEVIINNTLIEDNADAGINITYSGGYQLINNTQLIRNKGYGIITEYLQLNRSRIEFMQKMEIVRGRFMFNDLIGLRVGNYCLGGSILVNESHFSFNKDEAIEYLSCNISTGSHQPMNFSVAFTDFNENARHGILMRPLLNTVGIITNCTFVNHSLGTLRIDNGYDLLISKWYREFPVDYNIFENKFERNRGRYVVYLRLTDSSPKHRMFFKFNKLKNNYIQESFMYTNPRNRANAVAVISSGNIEFTRNDLDNRRTSVRELATHLLDPSVKINGTENFWDIEVSKQSEFGEIHASIFDKDDRYNLAEIEYYPVLKTDRFYENQLTNDVPRYNWIFSRPGNIIGGLLDYEDFTGRQGQTYYVDRDIYVHPDKKLTLERDVTLAFAPSVGMVVYGCLRADGHNSQGTIHFKLWTDPDLLPLENRTASVRLANGTDLYEGRLEVLIDDEWGTVCSEGWTDVEASLVCQQLGLIYIPDQGGAILRTAAPPDMRVLMSWVVCEENDDDLTVCRSLRQPDISCSHSQDVYLRCQDPTWAGVTLPSIARLSQNCETQLRAVHFERAGLLDAETMMFAPALRIDYNFYTITALTIVNSLSDGVHINYIHPYERARLEYMQIHNNQGNGIVTRYPRLDLRHSNITGSKKSGLLYDPFFTEFQALAVRSMIHELFQSKITDSEQLRVDRGKMRFLLCPAGSNERESHEYYKEITAIYSTYRIILQVLDFYPLSDVEEVTVFDAPRQNIESGTKRWRIPEDLVDFPIISTSYTITIRFRVRGIRTGRLTFAVISQEARAGPPVLTTLVHNTTLIANYRGLQTKHYNSPSNRKLDIFHRFFLETIRFNQVNVLNSKKEAVYMPSVTKFNDDYIPTYEDMTVPERVATIRYNISFGVFRDNAVGILAEHNHVDFANNVWQWSINYTRMERTGSGGVEIEVPRVNDIRERMKHTVAIVESTFINNDNFACAIKGYYSDVRVENNRFENNRCRLGLFTISGMEKNMSLISNRISSNVGRYMLDLDITSHSEYSEPVIGIMQLNDISNNRYEGLDPPGYGNSPKTYAVAFRGVQHMQANQNIFNNPQLGYELVAGITALSLGSRLDVKKNYWGRRDYGGIMDRIFDFDDWNNYGIAEFFPYLTKADFDSDLSGGEPVEPPLDTTKLGGRIVENKILAYKPGKPYIVEQDLTVMPDATLTISAGTEIQFRPNVGILVLGRLIAKGVEYNRIKMRPVQPSANPVSNQRKRRATSSNTIRLHGDGTLFKDAGFLELYNTSTRSWNIMCDNQFNEKSAEVVCRELGKETINVRVRFTHLYDFYIYGEPQYFLKEFWFESYYCRGDETDLDQCARRYNYNMQQCIQAANYTFIVCGERNLDPSTEYWGNIRFGPKSYEEQPLEDDIGRQESVLKYVDIEGAGMLHGEKVGAIQTTYVSPELSFLNITNSAENGLDIIAPRGILEMERLNISNNLGFGLNFLILNGESSERDSSFLLLGESTIPYHVYGLVEICRMEKEIKLDTRMILYYKYGPNERDCVKIIRSSSSRSKIGLRFLQVNMFHEDFSRNVLEIFDGSEINEGSVLAEILANTSSTGKLYKSSGNVLTVHLHASVSHGMYGFIAEVVQVPLTGLTYPDSNYKHMVTKSISKGNQDGALQYKNVGEVNPSFFMDQCWLEGNGVAILNLTSPPTIDISLQGTLLFRFASNFVSGNKGGTYLSLHTKTIATALRGNITNNIFSFGTNGEALNITGHYYQRLYMFQNYIFNYTTGDWRDVVHIRDVVVNYTYNYLDNNTGNYILTAYNNKNTQAKQLYTKSGFMRNNATALTEATIKVGQGLPFFENNYIVNEYNDFEMETYPKPIDEVGGVIQAQGNWWGSELRSYINGKLWDKFDEPDLVSVNFWQPKLDNRSVVEGKCLPGWKLDNNRCYRFMGGALPYYEARDFCRKMDAFLGEARDREGFFNYLLRLMRNTNNPRDKVWVMSEVGSSRCSAFEYSVVVYEEDCWNLLYPFICEKDPYIAPPVDLERSIWIMAVGISAGIGGVLLLVGVILGILWCVKSKRREKERFERTASLRSSMRLSKSTLTVLSEGHSRRRLNEIDLYSQTSSAATKTSRGTEDLNGSMGSLNRSYRNGRAAPVIRDLGDRRGLDRNRRRELERAREDQMEIAPSDRRGRRYPEEEEESRGREESESDKKEFEDTEEEDSFDSDPEEEEGEEEEDDEEDEGMAAGGTMPGKRLYQNSYPLPGMGAGDPRRANSREELYENQQAGKSKSLTSFSQPENANEPTVPNVFFPPRRPDLPSPPPTPGSHAESPVANRRDQYRPSVAPKPSARPFFVHPGQMRNSPDHSEGSLGSGSGRPSPLPRKVVGGSQASSQRASPLVVGGDYENQAAPLPSKPPMGSIEFVPRSNPPPTRYPNEPKESYEYRPQTLPSSPTVRLPNLPRYSPPLPMDGPPSYEETHNYSPYMNQDIPDSYYPSQEPPQQDVQYLPRQPDRRQFPQGSRDRHGGSREPLGGSREQLMGSRDRLNRPPYHNAYSPDVLYLNRGGSQSDQQDHLETEI